MAKASVMSVVGARPQFIKAAPVERAFAASERLESVLVHTGQHYDPEMSEVFFEELDLPRPALELTVSGDTHAQSTGHMMATLEAAMLERRPDAVLVYGDTNSTLAGTLAAAKLNIPIAHVEAGLRSFNRGMPEEVNRVVADHLSALLLAPTAAAVEHLSREGLGARTVWVGDVMYDATLQAVRMAQGRSRILEMLGLTDTAFVLCTIHRAENTGDAERLADLLAYVRREAGGRPIVFPVHPRTLKTCETLGVSLEGFVVTAPLGYLAMHRLLDTTSLVLTDSGGLQKEAYFHRRSCITLRDETEWTETVDSGWNRLWTAPDWVGERGEIADYGDGRASERIVAELEARLS